MTDRRCESRTCPGEPTIPGVTLGKMVGDKIIRGTAQAARLEGRRAHGFPVKGAVLCGRCAVPRGKKKART